MPATEGRSAASTGRESAGRFAQRARDERRRRRRVWLALAGLVITVAGTLVLVGRSGVVRVQSVQVAGERRYPASEVIAAAAITPAAPMWRLDERGVRDRVAALPWVDTVTVTRQWPRTVRISVTERQPVAVVTATATTGWLVDATGVEIAAVTHPPAAGLLLVALTERQVGLTPQTRRPLVTAALAVAAALPPPLRARVAGIDGISTQRITVRLTDGKTVSWGNAERSDRKAAVLTALLVTPYAVYDVSAPEAPAVR